MLRLMMMALAIGMFFSTTTHQDQAFAQAKWTPIIHKSIKFQTTYYGKQRTVYVETWQVGNGWAQTVLLPCSNGKVESIYYPAEDLTKSKAFDCNGKEIASTDIVIPQFWQERAFKVKPFAKWDRVPHWFATFEMHHEGRTRQAQLDVVWTGNGWAHTAYLACQNGKYERHHYPGSARNGMALTCNGQTVKSIHSVGYFRDAAKQLPQEVANAKLARKPNS